ncbi:TPA: NAD-dependent epimerase/dehydratase family protein [Candidatus Micrarchaeota archaeon]|nr:NAD-dependent epimerase/dehydratase family protein [Candidatus Micrarchaeota archaeon]
MKKILVTGAFGQIGSELVPALRSRHGKENVIAADVRPPSEEQKSHGPTEVLDVTKTADLERAISAHSVDTIYHLAGLISAGSEKNPELGWQVNMVGLKNVLDVCVKHKIRLFWPSSIAVFGPNTPKKMTPQHTVIEPTTIYGVAKIAGELLCQYYYKRYGLDVRSVRYPGIIQWKTDPADGTTEYSIAMFYEGLKTGKYQCFLREDSALPMMYIDDAIKATLDLMDAPSEKLTIRMSYNLAAVTFTPKELADELKKHIPNLSVTYAPDFHQPIADSWPQSIDDSQAREDWNWKHKYGLAEMTEIMFKNLSKKLGMA